MRFDEYRRHDALGLAQLVAKREVSADELMATAMARLEEVNPKINAVTQTFAPRGGGDGPLLGAPFLLKDLGAQLSGTRTTGGSALFKDSVAAQDSAIVKAYLAAGLAIFGKTNTPEFGLMPVTEPALFGPSRNPWDLTRTPGGSSGGASAAVAAGIVPAAHASDGGGSIRVPAHACGLFGLKPSRGRVSFAPLGEGWGGASMQHAVTRSVRDSAALLDVVCRPQVGDPYFLAPPERPFVEEVGRDPGKLRIAFTTQGIAAPSIDPECQASVRDAAELCASLGHDVEEAAIPGDLQALARAAGQVIAASTAAMLDAEAERRGRPIEAHELEPGTFAMYRNTDVSGSAYVRAIQTVHAVTRQVAALFERFDVLLLSTAGRPAPPVGWLMEEPGAFRERLFAFMTNTQLFNNTGQPAMSVPLAWSAEGLPIGIQFVGPMGEEARLFRLAGQLEQARPWFDRVAPL
ncbi:amidase [Phenylobacterium sp.]|uniref:amidase n=1 Tax=Phenylobacterium sp. TaxID=1871053 RepID=UPI002E332F8D|nr:amidase [Phenylobacterium sp.]HEX2561102.1 amidase [Phenylobacterium sp.]